MPQTKEQFVNNLVMEVGESWRATINRLTEEQLNEIMDGRN